MLDVDLEAVITVARAGIPALLRRPEPRSGRLIAVASTAASRGLPMLAAYCAAKAGVVGLIRRSRSRTARDWSDRQRNQSRFDRHGHSR